MPSTSAASSSGTEAIGRTRPCAPSSRPTQSSPCTVSPSSSHSATISRFPTAWPPSSPAPVNLCWTTLLQVVPQESSPHSAASAIRRSPGGGTPNSLRSLPLEPPSSATVTIAVRSRVSRRNAVSEAYRPCPPPRATTRRRTGLDACAGSSVPWLLTSEIAVGNLHCLPLPAEPGGDLLGQDYAAVLATRAP